MSRIQHLIERHFGLVLLCSCVAGLVVPGFDRLPNQTAILVLALLMFISCYKLRDGGFTSLRWRDIALYYMGRYIMLPAVLWASARALAPGYATGIFLLSVLPAGVSSPAIASIYGGIIAPGFAIVILSQLLTPFLIPLQFAWMSHFDSSAASSLSPSPTDLFMTMVWCIFVPMLAYICVRKHQRFSAYIYLKNKFFSVLLIGFVIGLAIAKQRNAIFAQPEALAGALIATLLCFACYLLYGWLYLYKRPREERITYAACSGFNNAALGVTLALLHFPPPVILFVAVSEIAWSLLPLMMRILLCIP